MKLTYSLLCLFLPVALFAQPGLHNTVRSVVAQTHNPQASRVSGDVFTFCDSDSDGIMPISLDPIKTQILEENVGAFGIQGGIYLCTRQARIHLVTNVNGTPQKTQICNGSVGVGGFGMLDVAVNQDGDMYVSAMDYVFKINNNANCAIENTIDIGYGNSATSLSFDRDRNIYLGGFDSSIYRLNYGNYNTMTMWHNFAQGAAAGDFVMCNDKMYVAWNANNGCRLYEVTVDADTNYISHIDLGALPDGTFGLASELGSLYGVTIHELYKIDRQSMTFNTILTNNALSDEWYGAAGKNEALDFDVILFETQQNALNNVNPLPSTWVNTIPLGQTIYAAIRNTLTNQTIQVPIRITVNPAPAYTNPVKLSNCDGMPDSHLFDLRSLEDSITTDPNVTVSFHNNLSDLPAGLDPIPDSLVISGTTRTIYVRLLNTITGCTSNFNFKLEVNPRPSFNPPGDLIVCNTGGAHVDFEKRTLVIAGSQQVVVTYHDSNAEAIAGTNAFLNPLFATGNREIFARITDAASGCFATGSFWIRVLPEHTSSTLSYRIDASDWTYDANIIYVQTNGNYEYSIDGERYQDSPIFAGLSPGDYLLKIRDKDNCGTVVNEVVLLMYPKFFTPNGDGHHDLWNILLAWHEPGMTVEIYDRYGKVITTLSGKNPGWDGTMNGLPLPSSDYWFTVIRANGKHYKGHFTLKR